jgi:sulfur relay (sulfurtransferase) DsrC/TusE family protein
MTEPSPMPELDAEGFVVDPNDWAETVAVELARGEGIVLGEDH